VHQSSSAGRWLETTVAWGERRISATTMKQFYVYIMANRARTLYTGMTNGLPSRVWEHKHMQTDGFTRRYLIDRLVYYELAPDAESAIQREKQIKGWVRRKKVALIESINPDWRDLSQDFLDVRTGVPQSPFHSANRERRDSSLSKTHGRAPTTGLAQSAEAIQRGAQNDNEVLA